jgi:hypothetical protein
MSFFANMNLSRWMILGSLTGSAILGYFVWERGNRHDEIVKELARVPSMIRSIQSKALELDELQRLADKEGLKGKDDPEFYIRGVARNDRVKIGLVDITKRTTSPARGIEDRVYKIKPSVKNTKYSRGSIANFLYKLEEGSRRVRITHVKIEPADKVRPGEIGPDTWTFEAEMTSRQGAEGGS